MKAPWKKNRWVACNIDRIESRYGNIMIRGWAVDLESEGNTRISVCDSEGTQIPVYTERLVRADVNETFGKAPEYLSGMHILIDRAQLNTSSIFLIFQNGVHTKRIKVKVKHARPLLRVGKKQENGEVDYDLWVREKMVSRKQQKRQRAQQFTETPLFSVVIPLYNTPEKFLKEIVDSVLRQTYAKVELCLADGSSDARVEEFLKKRYGRDARLRYLKLEENRGISENTNAAIRMAQGDFIVFADHDDVLALDALYEMAAAVNQDPEIDVIYTDEDKINRSGTAYFGPHFKPDYNRELLCCNNYICHLFAVRKDLLQKIGSLNPEYDGAQDYDFVLRCCEQANKIHHIPKVLYHWRTHPDSTAGNPASKAYAFEAGRRAVKAHFDRIGIAAEAENTRMLGRYRPRISIEGSPLISILIPNKDHVEDLDRCLKSIIEKTTYPNYEILIIENNSIESQTETYYQKLELGVLKAYAGLGKQERIRILRYGGGFNYSAIHNFAVPYAKGEYLVLLNNDTEVQTGEWLEEMLMWCQQKEIGIVGAKLFYPDGTIQHAGVVIGLCGAASHLMIGAAGDADGYAGRLVSVQDVSAVTAACMMTKKSIYDQVDGLSEDLAVAYNDIDYCMKVRRAGYLAVFTPYAQLTHFESKTRGLEDSAEKQERLKKESDLFCSRWKKELEAGDPYYNPNLSLTKTDCSLNEG